jgi:hypothetical protein
MYVSWGTRSPFSQGYGHPSHAFPTDDADFDGDVSIRDHRCEPTFREVHVLHAFVSGCEHLAQGKVDRLQVRFQQTEVRFGQARQNAIWTRR